MDPNENVKSQWECIVEIRDGRVRGDREAVEAAHDRLADLTDAYYQWLAGGGFRATDDAPSIEALTTAAYGALVA